MTPEERLFWQALKLLYLEAPRAVVGDVHAKANAAIRQVRTAAVEEAKREEREACAELAESIPVGYTGNGPEYGLKVRLHVAEAIRARGQEEKE